MTTGQEAEYEEYQGRPAINTSAVYCDHHRHVPIACSIAMAAAIRLAGVQGGQP